MSGVTFGNKHSYTDFNIYLTDVSIGLPTPVRYKVDVPGANGSLDMTDNITPHIRYKNRNIKLSFKYAGEFEDWLDQETEIADYLHGKRMQVILDDDEDYYWDAFCTIDTFKSDRRIGTLVINCDCFPYKYYVTENSYTVNGDGTITCVVDRMEISPAFEIEAPTTVIYGDSSYTIESTATTEKTLSGDIVSFIDGTANPAVDLTADIEAVQDLHGYDHPWVGGAGKNKLENTATSLSNNGIIFTVNSDGSVKVSGTASAETVLNINLSNFTISESYILSGCPTGGSTTTYSMQILNTGATSVLANDTGNGATLASGTYGRVRIKIANGTVISSAITFYPMLRKATDSAEWEPYTNICPISGWDEVNVNVVGKNWLEPISKSGTTTGYYLEFSKNSTGFHVNEIHLREGVQYRFRTKIASTVSGFTVSVGAGSGAYSKDISMTDTSYVDGIYTVYFTPTATDLNAGDIFSFRAPRYTSSQSYTYNIEWAELSIASQNTENEYSPYNGQTYTTDLDGTRYGGTLDVTTGVLTVTWSAVDMGSLTWIYVPAESRFYTTGIRGSIDSAYSTSIIKCSGLKPDTAPIVYSTATGDGTICPYSGVIYARWLTYTTAQAFTTAVTGMTLMYELLTPTTVQLTAEQVMILKNQNNIWADSGEVEVTYLAQDFAGRKFFIPDLELTEGSHSLTIQGTGTTKVTYTNGRL